MHCPFCRHNDSRVIDSRTTDDGTAIRRRRQCPECGRRFTTVESASLSIVKRSGATEPFSRQKVLVGVRKACQGRPVTEDDLAVLAQRVEESIRAQGSAEIEAHEVGLAVLEPLRELDEVAYLRFASVYQAFDNLEDFEAAITLLRAERDATGQEPAGQQSAGQQSAGQQPAASRPHHAYRVTPAPPAPAQRRVRVSDLSDTTDTTRPGTTGEGEPPMTETANRAGSTKPGRNGKGKGVTIERIYTTPGVHPYDEVTWETRDVVQQNWKTGETIFEQRGVEFPDFWSVNASTIVTTKYFRGALGTPVRETGAEAAHRPRRPHLRQGRPRARLLRHRGRRHPLRARADVCVAPPGLLVQLPGVVQRRDGVPAAGERLLHPGRRGLDGLDPQLVQGGGEDLPGRLRRRPQPLPHPLVQGAAELAAGRRAAR